MMATVGGAVLQLDGDGRLRMEVPCVGCGYVLRGLLPGDECPECGAAVADSIAEYPLAAADPAWRAGLRRGLLVLVVVLGLDAAFVVLSPLVTIFLARSLPPTTFGRVAMVSSLVAGLFMLLRCVGVWWATGAEPNPGMDNGESLRRAARWLALISTGVAIAWWGVYAAMPGLGGLGWVYALIQAPRIAMGAAMTLSLVLLLHYLVRQARRLPAASMPRLATWGLALGWSALAVGAVGGTLQTVIIAVWIPGRAAISPGVSNGLMLAAITMGVGSLLGLAFAICQIVFYVRLRRWVPAGRGSGA